MLGRLVFQVKYFEEFVNPMAGDIMEGSLEVDFSKIDT